MKRLLILSACLLAAAACAQTLATPAEAFQAGKEFANQGKGAAARQVNAAAAAGALPYYGTTAPESANFQGGRQLIGAAGTGKQIDCQTRQAGSGFEQQECDAVNFMSKNPTSRPKFTLDQKTDPVLTGSRSVIQQPGAVPGASTQQCRVERIRNPATYLGETCTETQTLENLSCKRVLQVLCDAQRDGCDQGGIVPNSWAGDMATSLTPDGSGNYILQFGTIANNYWSGWGAVYDRHLSFSLQDVKLITRFALTRAAFDDWLMVKVNDQLVYVGPRGGDRLEIYSPLPVLEAANQRSCSSYWDETGSGWQCANTGDGSNAVSYPSCTAMAGGWSCTPGDGQTGMVRHCADCFSGPELKTSWDLGLDIDLRPHLRNGSNQLFMRTIVAGRGEGAVQLTTRQLCPRNCREQWDNSQCAALELRAR